MKKIILGMICLTMLMTSCSTENKKQEEAVDQTEMNQVINKVEEKEIPGAITFTVDPEIKYQVMESFGTSGCWWSQYVGGWEKEYKDSGHSVRDEIAMLLFDKDYGIGLTSYRYNIGAGSADNVNSGTYWDRHRKTHNFETAPFQYDWNKDQNAVWFLNKAVDLGVQEVIMFCNSPLERLTINGKAQVTKGKKENILPENYDDFARYVMDVSEHFVNENIPVKFISPINEPQWDWFEGQEGCHYEANKIAEVYKAFLEELEKRPGLEGVKLSGPESGEWKGDAVSYTSALLNDPELREHFDTIDNHSYWSDTASKISFKNWMKINHPDVKLRMSEWCEMVNGSDVTMDSAFHLAEVVAEDLTVLDVVSWQNWVGVAPGGYRDGLIYVNEQQEKCNPLKRLWGYGNYSKFIRPGYQRIDITGANSDMHDLKPVAFVGTNDQGEEELVLVVINESDETKKLSLDIPNAVEYTNVSVYETSENNNLDNVIDRNYILGDVVEVGQQSITTIILSRVGE